MALGLGLPRRADVGLLRNLQHFQLITAGNKFPAQQAIRRHPWRHSANGYVLKARLGRLRRHRGFGKMVPILTQVGLKALRIVICLR